MIDRGKGRNECGSKEIKEKVKDKGMREGGNKLLYE